jgi:hypothetical protein
MIATAGIRIALELRFLWLALPALLVSPDAPAQAYKCIDASGRTSYSAVPCPAAVTQPQARTSAATDSREGFLRQIHAIARHGHLGDIDFIEKTMSVEIEPKPQRSTKRTLYTLSPPPGSPATRIVYGFQAGPPGSGGYLDLEVSPAQHCITQAAVVKVFGAPQNNSADGEGRELVFEIHGGPYTTGIWVYTVQKPAVCARLFRLRVGHPSGSAPR